MKTKFFNRWNWEFDYGEEELSAKPDAESCYATAYYDIEGRLYRVEIVSDGDLEMGRVVYDYFCDNSNRVLEKRSLDEAGRIVVLVRFFYETEKSVPTQIAFYPGTGETKSVVRKDYLVRRNTAGAEGSG